VLHIGTEKTGSTTIQAFLSSNRRALRSDQSILVPRSCGDENCRDLATYAIRDNYFNEDHLIALGITDVAAKERFKRDVEARFSTEIEDAQPIEGRVVISSEHLQSRLKSDAELSVLADLLGRAGLAVTQVVVYLREQASTYQSMYSTALRAGQTGEPPQSADMMHWNHICDHRATLERWAAAFPGAQMSPRIYERDSLIGRDALADFCSVVQIDRAGLKSPEVKNRGLNGEGQALLREVNARAPWLLEASNVRARSEIVTFIDRAFGGASPAPSPALAESCRLRFADGNEWVRANYFPERGQLFSDESTVVMDAGGDSRMTVGAARDWIDKKLQAVSRTARIDRAP
jgi:hypothetical protein